MISWLAPPYVVYCCVLFSSTTGIAILRSQAGIAYSCPGTEMVFTCVVNTNELSWDIDFLSSPDIDRVAYFSSDSIGRLQRVSSQPQGTAYMLNLTSKSPLTSTMTAIASTDLSGAVISCQDGFTGSVHMDTLVVEIVPEPQKPNNVTVMMPPIHPSYDAAGVLNVTLEWDDESDPMHLGQRNQISSYAVTVYSQAANSRSIVYTANTSIPLALHYDQDYNVSVVASNCVGNSTPAETHIRLVHCGPSIGKDVSSTRGNQAGILKTYCLHLPGLMFVPDEIKPDKSILFNDCGKNESIHQHDGITSDLTTHVLVPILTASHLLLSLCTLIVGFLLGLLSYQCCKRRKSSKTMDKKFVSSTEEPVYSEIPPKPVPSVNHVSESVKSVDNVAYSYGQVSS